MLKTLELYQFIIHVGPWIIFALICLLALIFLGERYDYAKDKLAEKEKQIEYLERKIQFLEGKNIIKAANEHYRSTDKEVKK